MTIDWTPMEKQHKFAYVVSSTLPRYHFSGFKAIVVIVGFQLAIYVLAFQKSRLQMLGYGLVQFAVNSEL
jgi:hypothetical protein